MNRMQYAKPAYPALPFFLAILPSLIFPSLPGCNTAEVSSAPATAPSTTRSSKAYPLVLCQAIVNRYVQDSKYSLDETNNGIECIVDEHGELAIFQLSGDRTLEKGPEKLDPYPYKDGKNPDLILPVWRIYGKVEAFGEDTSSAQASASRTATIPTTEPTVEAFHHTTTTQISGGDRASCAAPSPNHGYGTAGVNVVFNGKVVCLGCAHVMCDSPSATLNSNVYLGGGSNPNAKLWSYQPLNKNGQNYWDLAMAAYDSVDTAAAKMIGGAYPDGLPMCVCTNDACHKSGVGSGFHNNISVVLGVSGPVKLTWQGTDYPMIEQVVFSDPNTVPVDSGAVVCRNDSNNSMIGLEWGRSSHQTFAGPLYRAQWSQSASTTPYLALRRS